MDFKLSALICDQTSDSLPCFLDLRRLPGLSGLHWATSSAKMSHPSARGPAAVTESGPGTVTLQQPHCRHSVSCYLDFGE